LQIEQRLVVSLVSLIAPSPSPYAHPAHREIIGIPHH
jgi:hypothetical protein